MTTQEINKKFNIKILLVWLGFCLITVCMALFLADAIDWHACWWKAVLGIPAYGVLIYGTVKLGAYVNQERHTLIAKAEKAEKKAVKK